MTFQNFYQPAALFFHDTSLAGRASHCIRYARPRPQRRGARACTTITTRQSRNLRSRSSDPKASKAYLNPRDGLSLALAFRR